MMRFWFAAIFLVQSQIPVQQVQPGGITGRLFSTKGTPEPGVRIAAVPAAEAANKSGAGALFGISLTDNDGRYRLENLPPGSYYIFAGLIDLPSYYPNATTIERATAIDVDAGVIVSGVDFSMARPTGLTVAGRLAIPSTMEVDAGWTVTLSPQTRGAVGASLQSNVSRDGSFEFPRVAPGEYRLASPLRGTTALSLSVVDEDILDVLMPVVDCNAGVSVNGRLVGTPQSTISSISLNGSSVGCTPVVRLAPDGSFTFKNVPEGRYQIQLSPAPLGWSTIPLSVEKANLENVEVRLPTYIAIKGRADVEDGSTLPRAGRGAGLPIQAVRSSGGISVTSSLLDNGTFELLLPTGRYKISVPGIPGGYYLKSMTSGLVDLAVHPFEVGSAPPDDIKLTLGVIRRPEPPGVRVTGRVTFAPTGALPNSEGVLLVSSGSRNSAVRESLIGPDGSFEFTGVSPGTYNIETFPDNPAALYGIVVNKTDVTGIEFILPVLVKVKGGIEWPDAQGVAPQPARANVSVQFTRKEGNKMQAWGALAQSGAFHFYLPEGDYRFSVSEIPANFDLGSVTAGDANVLEDGLRVRSDSDPPDLRVMLRAK
jgi:hypothetical protein